MRGSRAYSSSWLFVRGSRAYSSSWFILYLFVLLFLGYSFDFWGKVLSSAKGCEVLGCPPFPYRSIYFSRAMLCSYWSYMGYISMFISICLGPVSCLGTSFLFTCLFLVPVLSEGSYYFYLECSRSGRVLHSFLLVVFPMRLWSRFVGLMQDHVLWLGSLLLVLLGLSSWWPSFLTSLSVCEH